MTAQTATPQASTASQVAPVALDDLVRAALQHNPDVQAALHRTEALKHRIPQAKTLPDPRVSVGWNGDPAPFDVTDKFPPSFRSVQAMQTIPPSITTFDSGVNSQFGLREDSGLSHLRDGVGHKMNHVRAGVFTCPELLPSSSLHGSEIHMLLQNRKAQRASMPFVFHYFAPIQHVILVADDERPTRVRAPYHKELVYPFEGHGVVQRINRRYFQPRLQQKQ